MNEGWIDPPDNLGQAGAKGPVFWSEDFSHHCVGHRTNSHPISNCCHHQGGHQAHLLSFTIPRKAVRRNEDKV